MTGSRAGLAAALLLMIAAPSAMAQPSSTTQPAPKRGVGENFRDCGQCPVMVTVPAGSFVMGSPANEPERELWKAGIESPQHKVTIARPFAAGKFEVTFAEWDACVAGGGCDGYAPRDQGWGHGARPVINVSWNDAQTYVAWLKKKTRKDYRLLSEAEWEYAARAGSTTPFSGGSGLTRKQAHYLSDQTADVGSYPANAFGLHDMHGNVWEWVEDCWNDSYTSAPANGAAWTTGDCDRRVVRGGSWTDLPWVLRVANRNAFGADYRGYLRGFRVARTTAP
jgi:formylglycine-generating enzyme required for sulfatase activity